MRLYNLYWDLRHLEYYKKDGLLSFREREFG